ncbi:MAG: DUF72 domain-containing protein [Acidobacteriota bacterium]
MHLHVGTSGYSYDGWHGSFYPEKLKAADRLAHYGTVLSSVEVNNTYYRMPKKAVVAKWADDVPDDFRFVIKASRRITHFSRLKEPEDKLEFLFGSCDELGDKLGAVLFQLPPNFKADLERLESFLTALPPGRPVVFELRHDTWEDEAEAVTGLLRSHGAAGWCCADTEDGDPVLRSSADFGYLRLRRPDYDDAALRSWVERIREHDWERVFVFFKHEDAGAGPVLAQRFRELFGEAGS